MEPFASLVLFEHGHVQRTDVKLAGPREVHIVNADGATKAKRIRRRVIEAIYPNLERNDC